MLIWSVSGIAVKHALVVFRPLTLIVLRFTVAVLLMVCVGLLCRRSGLLGLQMVQKTDLPWFLLGGLFQPFLYYLLETYTYDALSSPTIAGALLSTNPILTPLFAVVLLRESVTRYNVVGIVVATIGVLMLTLIGSTDFAIGNVWGILTAFLAVVAAILYSVALKRIPSRYSPLTIVCYMQGWSLLLFYVLWGLTDVPQWTEMQTEWAAAGSHLLTALCSIGYLAVFSSVAGFVLFCYTVRSIGITRTNAFNNVRPAMTAVFMWLLLGEQLPVGKLIGIVLIIVGLFICQRSRATHSPKREE